jgi:hypothetical protein
MDTADSPQSLTPTVKLLFDGLFFLRFDSKEDPARECQIGVLTTAINHELTVTIIETTEFKEGVYKYTNKVFTLSPSICRLLGDVNFHIRSATSQPNVTRYGYGDGKPLPDRSDTDKYPWNYKWIVDFANGEFNEQKIVIAPGAFSPILHLNAGDFYTHAYSKTQYDVVKADVAERYFGWVAMTIGVNIQLRDGDAIVLERDGKPLWEFDRNPEATYLIHFQNTCPACTEPTQQDVALARNLYQANTYEEFIELEKARETTTTHKPIPPDGHSDLQYYYDAFIGCSGLDKYDFKAVNDSGAAPLLCYPAGGGTTGGT